MALPLRRLHLSNLTLGAKMAAIAALFAVPLVLLVFLFVAQTQRDVAFSAKELDGARYLDTLWPLFVRSAAGANTATAPAEAAMTAARAAAARYDGAMASGPAVEAFLRAVSSRAPAGDVISAGQTAIQKVGDGSNLILDPDLDSFYLMDIVVVRLPELIASIQAVRDAAQGFAQDRERVASRTEFVLAVGRLLAAIPPVAANLDSSYAANASGEVRRALEGPQGRYSQAVTQFREIANAMIEPGTEAQLSGNVARLTSAQQNLVAESDRLWQASNAALKALLQARVDGFVWGAGTRLAVVGLVLIVAGLVMVAVVRSIQRPVRDLVAAMGRLRSGDTAFDTPYTGNANEIGDIARALEDFRRAGSELERVRGEREKTLEAEAARAAEIADLADSVAVVVAAARRGDFSQRAAATRDLGRLSEVVVGLNDICATSARFLNDLRGAAGAYAANDLTARLSTGAGGQFDAVVQDLNAAMDALASTVVEVQGAAEATSAAATQIASGSGELSKRTESQAASLEEINATVEALMSAVNDTVTGANDLARTTETAAGQAESGGKVASEAVAAMGRIEEATTKVKDIVELINSIAFQTNLLALNASVEAARAGEAGRGFAVVADEVRRLAQQTSDAARSIHTLIDGSTEEVAAGVVLVRDAGAALREITESVQTLSSAVANITQACRSQASGLGEIAGALRHLDEITNVNASIADENAEAAQSLSGNAGSLASAVAQFRTDAAHRAPLHRVASR